MTERRDPYEVLGVARDAERDEIRKAYRVLARKCHPDLNPGDAPAEARFKEIAAAWAVLSDAEKRAQYDEFGSVSLEAGFDADEARRVREQFGTRFGHDGRQGPHGSPEDEFHFGGIDDLMGQMFGQRGGMRVRGADLEASLELDFLEATEGCEKKLRVGRPVEGGPLTPDSVTVRIPPGVSEDGKLRIPGKGGAGIGGGPAGDLFITLRIRPHPVFSRSGNNLTLDLPVTVREATLGAAVEVPTLDGQATLKIPPGTSGGSRMRLRGKGVPAGSGRAAGDLIVRIKIEVPKELDDETRAAIESIDAFEDAEIRKELFS